MESLTTRDRAFFAYLASFLTPHKRELFPRVILNRTRHLTVVVEDVHQPHNASACLRSCDCFGLQDVHIIENRNEFTTNRGVELGASRWLSLHRYSDIPETSTPAPDIHTPDTSTPNIIDKHQNTRACLEKLKADGFAIVMTSPHQPNCELETFDVTQKAALVFGNEKDGCSDTVRELADHVLRVPIHGFTESFNISVAVAVCLHHLVWRLRESGIRWQITDNDRDALIYEWVRTASSNRVDSLEKRFNQIWQPDVGLPEIEEFLNWPDWSQVPRDVPLERRNRQCLSE